MTDPKKDFIRKLEGLDRSLSTREKFRDLMELGYCAWAKKAAPDEARANELEARYMSIVNRYKDKETVRSYPNLLAIAWNAVMGGGVDFLGEVSSELETLDVKHGQFFTPYNVSQMMADITLFDLGPAIEQEGYLTISEPAAGAGGMMLAAADVLQKYGYNPTYHMLVQAVDVSPLPFHMCYLQLTWRGIPAQVIRGDTLRAEAYETAWTLATFPFFEHHGSLFEKGSRVVSPQLSFFEQFA